MALNCIRNQPIDFCTRIECYDEEFCIRVDTADVSQFQVELTQSTGAELVQNGDFASSTGWTFGTNWAYDGVNDEADATGATTGILRQNGILNTGDYYVMSFEVKNYVSGVIFTGIGNAEANGTYYGVFISQSDDLMFEPNNVFTGSIDNVSVKKLTYLGWRILDCDTNEILLEDYDNSDGLITFLETTHASGGDPPTGLSSVGRALMRLDWDAAPLNTLPLPGCYKICLVAESDQIGCTLESQCICLATNHPDTVLITASNDENFDLGGDDYLEYVTPGWDNFELSLRVEARLWHPHWEEDYENYQFSDFARKTVKFSSVEVMELTTEELPLSQLRALAAMAGHDTFEIDAIRYHKFGSGIAPEWTKGTDHAPFSIEVVEDSKGLKNSNC